MDMRKLIIASLLVCMPLGAFAQKAFKDWPDGVSPKVVGELVSKRFVEVPHPNFNGNPAPPNEITYPETCAWFGALRYADITNNKKLLVQLEERFLPIFGPGTPAATLARPCGPYCIWNDTSTIICADR